MKTHQATDLHEKQCADPKRRRFAAGLGLTIACATVGRNAMAAAANATAGAWPAGTVRLIVPFSPGGSTDILARYVANRLSVLTGESFIVDNRPGAGGVVANRELLSSKADGHSVLLVTPTFVTGLYTNPSAQFSAEDFKAVSLLATTPLVVCAHPEFGPSTPEEFIAYARENPEKITYSSSGAGSAPHLAAELLQQQAGVRMTHIPFKGGGDAVNAVVGNHVNCYFAAPEQVQAFAESGNVKLIGLTSLKPSHLAKNVQTFNETAVPGYQFTHYTGVVVSRDTDDAVIEKISAALRQVLAEPDTRARIMQSFEVASGETAEAQSFISKEHATWSKTIKDLGLAGTV